MFKNNHRHKGHPYLTIEKWPKNAFKNKIVNRVSELFSSFIVWEIWKTRNIRIFETKQRKVEEIWTLIETHLKETITLNILTWEDFVAEATKRKIISMNGGFLSYL